MGWGSFLCSRRMTFKFNIFYLSLQLKVKIYNHMWQGKGSGTIVFKSCLKYHCWRSYFSVKNFTPTSHETSYLNVDGRFDAGEELLDYWQVQWEAIHVAQDQVHNLAKILRMLFTKLLIAITPKLSWHLKFTFKVVIRCYVVLPFHQLTFSQVPYQQTFRTCAV